MQYIQLAILAGLNRAAVEPLNLTRLLPTNSLHSSSSAMRLRSAEQRDLFLSETGALAAPAATLRAGMNEAGAEGPVASAKTQAQATRSSVAARSDSL